MWVFNFLQNLGRYVFGTGNRFAAGHKMGLNGPIALDHDTKITAICFADDPELGEIRSEFGKARFVQIVGITDDEYRLIQEWSTHGLVDALREKLPMLVTDLGRSSILDDPTTAARIERRVAAEGSSEDLTFAGELSIETDNGRLRLELGALYAACLPRAMRGRIRHGRPYELRGREVTLQLQPGKQAGYRYVKDKLVLTLTQELANELEAALRTNVVGSYRFTPWLEIVVTRSFIRDQQGKAIDVRGIADPDEAKRLISEENERLRQESDEDDDEDDDDDDDDDADEVDADDSDDSDDDSDDDADDDEDEVDDDADDDEDEVDDEDDEDDEDEDGEYDDDDDDDDEPPDPARVRAALGMTERALRLAPNDSDVQFTHAMLLLDGERAGVVGNGDLLGWLPKFAAPIRISVAVRMGSAGHAQFAEAVDAALAEALPDRILSSRSVGASGGASIASFGNVAHELFGELAEAILQHAPDKMAKLVPLLPDDASLLGDLAWKASQASHVAVAGTLYERVLALPIPDDTDTRRNYLRTINNACVRAHAAKAYDAAVRLADRVQSVAHENPYIFHSAACAYAAVGNYAKAFEQVKLAIHHEYDHLGKVENDTDLGQLLEWPEFRALFRDWHARQERN
jgi:suppressor of fused